MRLTFYEVYGDPENDEQVTVTRLGLADLVAPDDVLLNNGLQHLVNCEINECSFDLSGLSAVPMVLQGLVHPNTRRQKIVRFTPLHAEKGQQTSSCIVLLSGHLNRGEAIFEIRPSGGRFDHTAHAMVCFTPGARILTAFGDLPIEQLRPGDLINARDLINGKSVTLDHSMHEIQYMHLLFDEHQVVFCEGVATESFFPGPNALMSLEETARDEVFAILPNLASQPLCYTQMDRLTLRPNQVQVLQAA